MRPRGMCEMNPSFRFNLKICIKTATHGILPPVRPKTGTPEGSIHLLRTDSLVGRAPDNLALVSSSLRTRIIVSVVSRE